MRLKIILMAFFCELIIVCPIPCQEFFTQNENYKVRSQYDKGKDKTIMQVGPMIIHGHLWELPEIKLSMFYSGVGMQLSQPAFITLVLDTFIKPDGTSDLIKGKGIGFTADENIWHLGSMRLQTSRVGKEIAIEMWILPIPLKTFIQLAERMTTAKKSAIHIGNSKIELKKKAVEAIAKLAASIPKGS
ncbi:MAG: hypothetical protein AB1757_16920 [Acidobacteriota bacterium]